MIRSLIDELKPLLLSVLFLGLGILILLAAKHWINNEGAVIGDAVLVSLLAMPVLVYMIISGRLRQFKAPGGIEADFVELASTSVIGSIAHEPVIGPFEWITVDKKETQIIDRGKTQPLNDTMREIEETRPTVMTVTFEGGHYTLKGLREYVDTFSRMRNFKLVVFLDRHDRFLAYMTALAAKNLLSTPDVGMAFVKMINEGRAELLSYPGVERRTISIQSTNAEALREMTVKNIEALVVTDENNRLAGIVERDLILSRMVLALTPA